MNKKDQIFLGFGIPIVVIGAIFTWLAMENLYVKGDQEWSNNATLIAEIGVGIIITLFVLMITKDSERKTNKKIETIYSSVKKENYKKLSVKIDRIRVVKFQLDIIDTKIDWLINVITIHNKSANKSTETIELLKIHLKSVDTNFETLNKLNYFNAENFDKKLIGAVLNLRELLQNQQNVTDIKIDLEHFEQIKIILSELMIGLQEELISTEMEKADLIMSDEN